MPATEDEFDAPPLAGPFPAGGDAVYRSTKWYSAPATAGMNGNVAESKGTTAARRRAGAPVGRD